MSATGLILSRRRLVLTLATLAAVGAGVADGSPATTHRGSLLAVGAGATTAWLLPEFGGPLERFVGAVIGGLTAVGVYFLLQRMRHSNELTEFASVFRRGSHAQA